MTINGGTSPERSPATWRTGGDVRAARVYLDHVIGRAPKASRPPRPGSAAGPVPEE
jgi:hypothetical protein